MHGALVSETHNIVLAKKRHKHAQWIGHVFWYRDEIR